MNGNVQRWLSSGASTLVLWMAVMVLGSPAPSRAAGVDRGGFEGVVAEHLRQYPRLEIQDLYKLAFQAALGAEHAVASREVARMWLEGEIRDLVETSQEQLSDPLSPDGELVRINLRPYIAIGGDPDLLLNAFVRTAADFDSSRVRLEEYWSTIEAMARSGDVPFGVDQLQSFWVDMKDREWPAVHHSATYKRLYHPAYRVVLRRLVEIEGRAEAPGRGTKE